MKKDKVKIESEMVGFRCPSELAERMTKMAEKGEITRTRLIVNLCQMSLEGLETCEKVGLLQLGLLCRDMQEHMKAWSYDMKSKKQIPINNI